MRIGAVRGVAGAALAVAVVASFAACSSGGAPANDGGGSGGSIGPASAKPSGRTVESLEEAAAVVIASDPRFRNVRAKDPDAIGQCCWWAGEPSGAGWNVKIVVGWGDCPAGCIHRHTWNYAVARDGAITLLGDSGDPIPPGGVPSG